MPWQSDDNEGNPWGKPRKNSGGRGSGGRGPRGPEGPDLDDMIRKSGEHLRSALPGGFMGLWLIGLLLVLIWLSSGIYKVQTNEQAAILRFGKFVETAGSGLHWHLPYPIEDVEIRGVTDENTIEIGTQLRRAGRGLAQTVDNRDESLMLTGDENIVDIKFNVIWRIKSLEYYLFNLRDPALTVKAVAESVMREVVGRNPITPIITNQRDRVQDEALQIMQTTLDAYESGITVLRVQIQEAGAPEEVKEAFLDVQRAHADQERLQNEAEAYRNNIVPRAKGQAEKIVQDAEAYRAKITARAEGEAARFLSIYEQYRLARDVTRKRLYLETMEDILEGMNKIILDDKAGAGVVPYLPLDGLKAKAGARKEQNQPSEGDQNNE